LSNQRHQPSSSADTLIQITKHSSPSCDNKDVATTTSQHITPPIAITTKRPLLGTYQQKDSDYKISSPNLNPNTIPLSSPISSSSSSSASFTCQKGQEELSPSPSPSPSPKGSSLNQYLELTSQTESIDLSRDERCHPTTRRLMTMSISPNRLHNQTHSSITNITNGLKQQRDQTHS
jgi:hypothetical protein